MDSIDYGSMRYIFKLSWCRNDSLFFTVEKCTILGPLTIVGLYLLMWSADADCCLPCNADQDLRSDHRRVQPNHDNMQATSLSFGENYWKSPDC